MDSKRENIGLTVVQCRMARTGLGLGVRDLADMAMVAPNTISRFERGEELKPRTLKALKDALEDAGARFYTTESGEDAVAIGKD